MRYNEMPADARGKKPEIIRRDGYIGKNYYRVNYTGQSVDVRCADETAALFLAAKRWGFKWTRPEYHQTAKVTRLRLNPEMVIG